MDIQTLEEIVKRADLRQIKRALEAAGFVDCRREKELRRVSLYEIAKAPYEKTSYVRDGKGNEFVGDLCRGVKGYEERQFVLIQQLSPVKRGGDDLSTKKMLIYALIQN